MPENQSHDAHERVVVTYKVRPSSRSRIKMLAAYLGITQAELVEGWAVEQLQRLGLPDPDRK